MQYYHALVCFDKIISHFFLTIGVLASLVLNIHASEKKFNSVKGLSKQRKQRPKKGENIKKLHRLIFVWRILFTNFVWYISLFDEFFVLCDVISSYGLLCTTVLPTLTIFISRVNMKTRSSTQHLHSFV